jgi:phosphoribosylformylglycinamidine synthase
MLAGGVGFAKQKDSLKGEPKPGEKVVVMGGDNYRIGMGGGAVSSVDTGLYANAIELNAVQRANPEMQKRVSNVIRTLAESDNNPIVSIHDHGAGGHLNCLSELVEATGGKIDMDKLPIGDPTLSAKEIIGNESQERMGLLVEEKDLDLISKIADRERAPMYVVGETTDDMQFVFERANGEKPIDLRLDYMIGKPPRISTKPWAVIAAGRDPLMASSKAPLGRRNRAAVRAFPGASSTPAGTAALSMRTRRMGRPALSTTEMTHGHPAVCAFVCAAVRIC